MNFEEEKEEEMPPSNRFGFASTSASVSRNSLVVSNQQKKPKKNREELLEEENNLSASPIALSHGTALGTKKMRKGRDSRRKENSKQRQNSNEQEQSERSSRSNTTTTRAATGKMTTTHRRARAAAANMLSSESEDEESSDDEDSMDRPGAQPISGTRRRPSAGSIVYSMGGDNTDTFQDDDVVVANDAPPSHKDPVIAELAPEDEFDLVEGIPVDDEATSDDGSNNEALEQQQRQKAKYIRLCVMFLLAVSGALALVVGLVMTNLNREVTTNPPVSTIIISSKTNLPSTEPTAGPSTSIEPTISTGPSISNYPSNFPSGNPTITTSPSTDTPSSSPSNLPTSSAIPSGNPTSSAFPSGNPTTSPTRSPSSPIFCELCPRFLSEYSNPDAMVDLSALDGIHDGFLDDIFPDHPDTTQVKCSEVKETLAITDIGLDFWSCAEVAEVLSPTCGCDLPVNCPLCLGDKFINPNTTVPIEQVPLADEFVESSVIPEGTTELTCLQIEQLFALTDIAIDPFTCNIARLQASDTCLCRRIDNNARG